MGSVWVVKSTVSDIPPSSPQTNNDFQHTNSNGKLIRIDSLSFTKKNAKKRKCTIPLGVALAAFTLVVVVASTMPPCITLMVSSKQSMDIAVNTLLSTLQYRTLSLFGGLSLPYKT